MGVAKQGSSGGGRRRGRPSKGQRELVWGRVGLPRSEDVAQLAEKHDAYKSDVVAALIEIGFAHLDELKLPSKDQDQPELPLAAS